MKLLRLFGRLVRLAGSVAAEMLADWLNGIAEGLRAFNDGEFLEEWDHGQTEERGDRR